MSDTKKIFICGGDLRQVKLAGLLAECGHKIYTYGLDSVECEPGVECVNNYEPIIADMDVIVLPLPCSVDEQNINMPLSNESLSLDGLFNCINESQLVLGGRIDEDFSVKCMSNNINIIDYFKREELVIRNVIPTAEGALQIAMEETATTIHDSKCLVLGYGRIGKYLSQALKQLGAHVSVEARSQSDLAWIRANSYKCVHISRLYEEISNFDIIFNTVPHRILDAVMLQKINKQTLIIDLASKMGGVDFTAASQLGLKVIWALSLPGKVAPFTSAKIIRDTIINIMTEWG